MNFNKEDRQKIGITVIVTLVIIALFYVFGS